MPTKNLLVLQRIPKCSEPFGRKIAKMFYNNPKAVLDQERVSLLVAATKDLRL